MFFKTVRSLRLQKGVDEQHPTSGAVPSPNSGLAAGLCGAGRGFWSAGPLLESGCPQK